MNIIETLQQARNGEYVKRKDWDYALAYSPRKGFFFVNYDTQEEADCDNKLYQEDYNSEDWIIVQKKDSFSKPLILPEGFDPFEVTNADPILMGGLI